MARRSSPQPKASETIQANDIVIPVLGPTGSGKSTFINYVIPPGTKQMKVGGNTTSCTTEPCPGYIIPIPSFPELKGHRLVLLDTPGFNDTYVDDVDILKRIGEWLADSHQKGALVGGVLYLHDISIKRVTSSARQNLEMFTRICGKVSMKKAVLVTTNWDSGTGNELRQRERELKEKYWEPIVQEGGKVQQFLRNRESAWDIISNLLECADLRDPLLLPEQLVNHRIPFSETNAGRHAVSVAERKKEGEKKQKKIMGGCVIQ